MIPDFPSAPTEFNLTPRNGQIIISRIIDGASNGAIIDYHSYSTSLDGISDWSTDVSFSTVSTSITLLTNNQIYYIRLNAHNSIGTSILYSSNMSAIPLINQPYTGSVTIIGTTNQYNTLTANTSMIVDTDELGLFSYQWNASGVDISGAINRTYILTLSEINKTIGVTVKYTDGQGTLESISSVKTAKVGYISTTRDFIFKILNSVWSIPTTKTLPIISSGLSFDG